MLSYKNLIFCALLGMSVNVWASEAIVESILAYEWYDPTQDTYTCSELQLHHGLIFKFQRDTLELTKSGSPSGIIEFKDNKINIQGTQDRINPAVLHIFFIPVYPLALVLKKNGTLYLFNEYTFEQSTNHIKGNSGASSIPYAEFLNGYFKLHNSKENPSYYLKNDDLVIEIHSKGKISFPKKELQFNFQKNAQSISM